MVHPVTQPDLKWQDIVQFAIDDLPTPNLRSQRVNDVAGYFFSNIGRLNVMLVLPSLVGDLTIQIQRTFDVAELAITKTLQTGEFDFMKHPKRTEIGALAQRIFTLDTEEQAQVIGTPQWQSFFLGKIRQGTQPVLMLCDSPSRTGLEALLSSCLTGCWTAFETMAGDLWETAVNIHPAGLAELKGARTRMSPNKEAREKTDQRNEDIKSIPLSELVQHEYKIENLMGTVLRTQVRFDSLGGIREAYSRAFFKKADGLASALTQSALDELSAIRNLIVHRAGKVDPTYERKVAYLNIPKAVVGDHIQLDGKFVAALLTSVINASIALIEAVDQWIAEN